MKTTLSPAALGVALAGFLLPVEGAELGMEAPPLKIQNWVRNQAVDLKAGGGKTVHVVEFWATWCGPCRRTIPHLAGLQKKYADRGVVVVGVSNETEAKVKPFVEKMADQMAYTVAVDDRNQTTAAYMGAFGVGGIPHAFVIDKKGRIAWHGHPMAGLDEILEQIVTDKYDLDAARRAASAEKAMNDYFDRLSRNDPSPELRATGERILQDAAGNSSLLYRFAWVQLRHPRIQNPDMELASRAAKAAYDASDGRDSAILDVYARAQFLSGRVPEAVDLQKQAVSLAPDEARRTQYEAALKEYQAKTP